MVDNFFRVRKGITVANTGGSANLEPTGLTVGSVVVNSSGLSGTATLANNSSYLGGTAAAAFQLNSTLAANVATMTANNSAYLGGTAAASYQLNSTLAANVAVMTSNNTLYLGGVAAASYATLVTENQTLTGGASVTSKNLGTVTSGTLTLDLGDRPMQHYSANGAHTLAPGSTVGSSIIDITNGPSANAVTTTGWTMVTGDSFDTTSGNKFRCHCSVGNGGSLIVIQALQ